MDVSQVVDSMEEYFVYMMRSGYVDTKQVLELAEPNDQRSRAGEPSKNRVG